MRRYDRRQTILSFAKRVAAEHGVIGSGKEFDDFIKWVTWERTGYPAFFMTDPWIVDFDTQLTEYFAGVFRCARCGRQVDKDVTLYVCDKCYKSIQESIAESDAA